MKKICLLVSLNFTILSFSQKFHQTFVSTDIDNFWIAYDKIVSTKDTVLQRRFLSELYLDNATDGLKCLIEVRNYAEKDFIDAINRSPRFWNSIRPNTLKSKERYASINYDIEKLKKLYPQLRPSTIYFAIGAFKTNGTIQGNKILIGSELSLANKTTVVDELPEWRQAFYKTQDPFNEIELLCTHEYIHSQQKELAENLLSMVLYEGIAEFVSCKATGRKSTTPAIGFGKANEKIVIDKFVSDLFSMSNNYNWMWGENRNELKMRDLGYYVGYEICERYYNQSKDKQKAIKDLIELDYSNQQQIEQIVDATKLLPKRLSELHQDYESSRPTIIKITPFENGSQNVKPGITKLTVVFSEPMTKYNTGLDYGELGSDYLPKISPERFFGDDGKSWTFEADLQPNQRYQILISDNFRNENGARLKPYLIEFKTAD